jgi:outer membrane receptor protein involved in Fe transport
LKEVTFNNAQSATSYGVEIEVKKSLDGLTNSRVINNINLLFNASFIKSAIKLYPDQAVDQESRRPMQGQAPYVINTALFYNSSSTGWQINLLYNVVGKNIFLVGNKFYADVYMMPRNVVDLTFSKNITERFQVKGGVTDILNQPMLLLQDGNHDSKLDRNSDDVIQKFRPGQVFSLGVSWRVY